jgi:hypothetical protein
METFSEKAKTWEPPAELQTSTPRQVQLTRLGKTVAVLATLLALFAVGLTGWMMNQAEADAARWSSWQSDATPAQGHITYMRQTVSGKNRVYRVEYAYPVGDLTYGGVGTVSEREWKFMRQGDGIRVFYRKSEPGLSWISGHEPKGVPWWAGPLTGTAMLIAPILLVWNLRRQRRLLEEGWPAKATITRVTRVRQQKGGATYRIDYAFDTMNGDPATGRSQARENVPNEGSQATVLYVPENARRNALYPLCMVRVVTYGQM